MLRGNDMPQMQHVARKRHAAMQHAANAAMSQPAVRGPNPPPMWPCTMRQAATAYAGLGWLITLRTLHTRAELQHSRARTRIHALRRGATHGWKGARVFAERESTRVSGRWAQQAPAAHGRRPPSRSGRPLPSQNSRSPPLPAAPRRTTRGRACRPARI
jgi:hypothetical protein